MPSRSASASAGRNELNSAVGRRASVEEDFRLIPVEARAREAVSSLFNMGRLSEGEREFARIQRRNEDLALTVKEGNLIPLIAREAEEAAAFRAGREALLREKFGQYRALVVFGKVVSQLQPVDRNRSFDAFRAKVRVLAAVHKAAFGVFREGEFTRNSEMGALLKSLNEWCERHLQVV